MSPHKADFRKARRGGPPEDAARRPAHARGAASTPRDEPLVTGADDDLCEDDVLVPEDDRVIGRAFSISLAVIGVVTVGVLVALALRGRDELPAPEVREAVAPRPVEAIAVAPRLPFTDVTEAAGIDFVHVNGAVGQKLLPETMGGGAAFFDLEGDGDPDLVLVNSARWSDTPFAASVGVTPDAAGPPPTMALYRNDGTGRFEDVTAGSGLDVTFYGMGVAAGDVDGDGDTDLFLTAVGENRLFENVGGRFVDVTDRAGVAGGASTWSTSAAFVDVDDDADLDLFVANYVEWSPEIDREIDFRLTGLGRAYGPPTQFAGVHPYLYRNDGNGRFTDVSAVSGVEVENPATGAPMAKALAVAPVDLDRDGAIDLVVANDTVQNFLFHNDGEGRFAEIGALAGVGFDSAGNATGAMGIDVADFRGERRLGIAIGNFANEMSSLFVEQGAPLQFADEAIVEGFGAPSRRALSFGLFFFDVDLDGRLDLLQANGHIEDEIERVQASQRYRQPAQLFWNAGPEARACFAGADGSSGDLTRPIVGRGATYADIDADGDLDVLLTQVGGAPLLLRNDQATGHRFLRVAVRGDGAIINRDAIGAWVELDTLEGETLRRQVMPTRSYLSQVELPVTFGLGEATEIAELRVVWPNGTVEVMETPEAVDTTVIVP